MKKILLAALAVLALFAMVACSDPTMSLSLETLQTSGDKTLTSNLTGAANGWDVTYKYTPVNEDGTQGTETTETYTAKFGTNRAVTFTPSNDAKGLSGYTQFIVLNGYYYFGAATTETTDATYTYELGSDGKTLKITVPGSTEGTSLSYDLKAVGTTKGIRGRWTGTAKDTTAEYSYEFVISSNTLDMVIETKITVEGADTPSTTKIIGCATYTDAGSSKLSVKSTYQYAGYEAATGEGTDTIDLTGSSSDTIKLTKTTASN